MARKEEVFAGFRVPYEVRKSKFGKGVFAKSNIRKGTLVWKFVRGVNVRSFKGPKATRRFLKTLKSAEEQKDWLEHSFHSGGTLNDALDDGKFFNHAEGKKAATCIGNVVDPLSNYAARDIKAGEEFTEDYGCFEFPAWAVKMCYELNCEMDYFSFKLPPGVAGFQVAYTVNKCKYGKGIFADDNIKRGALIWKYKRGINIRSFKGRTETRNHLAKLPSNSARKDWLSHMYHYRGYCNEILDDGKFLNTSSNPNTVDGPDPNSIYASKHIPKGEAILKKYGTYDWPPWLLKLMKEYRAISYYETATKH